MAPMSNPDPRPGDAEVLLGKHHDMPQSGAAVGPDGDRDLPNIHAHPTLSEALKEAVHGAPGHMINF